MTLPPEKLAEDAAGAFERLLARCIECYSAGDPDGLQALLAAEPALAARVRARLADLERLGLVERGSGLPARIGGHRILASLGRGGMSTVYLAEDARGARVALKLADLPLTPEDGAGGASIERARARFEREVRTVTRLSHPRLVAVRDAGEHQGRPWFSMDYVRGATLARVIERLRARGLPPESLTALDARSVLAEELESLPAHQGDATGEEPGDGPTWSGDWCAWCCRVAIDVAQALEHAHAAGVVHRDVKAANVLLRADGHAQLFDLGLAQVADQPTLTRSGDFAGTPYAVAPEQADARRGTLDARADVWGLGVTLYELLTLRRPFEALGPAALLRRILEEEPTPPRRHHPGLPRALENVLASALEKDPRRRTPTVAALREDLERFLAGRGVRARGASVLRRLGRFARARPAHFAAASLGLLVAVGVPTGLAVANAAVRAQARRAERAALEAQRLAAANAEVVSFLVGLFRPLEEDEAAVQAGALAMLDTQVEGLLTGLGEQPLVRASLLEASADVYANLGLYERALPLYDRALAIRQSELGEGHLQTADLLASLGAVHLEVGRPATAADLARRALEGDETAALDGALLRARLTSILARAEADLGDLAGARAHLDQALELLRSASGADAQLEAEVLAASARVAARAGDARLGLAHAEQSSALRARPLETEPAALLEGLDLVAELRGLAGDAAGAEAARARADALRAALAPHPDEPAPARELALRARDDDYEASFQEGITALQSRRLEEAVEHFERCLALRPGSAVCAYNIACARAVGGDVEGAFEALARAERSGLGLTDGRLDLLLRDADLAPLRGDARFAALLGRVERAGEKLREYTALVGVREPRGARTVAPGVLMVLHADGSTRETVLAGDWASVADALGLVLVAPSAPRARGPEPEAGFDWFAPGADPSSPPFEERARLARALLDVLESREVDRARVAVVGEGAAAPLAFDLALRAPGLVRGVLLVDGPAVVEGASRRARVAAALGLRAEIVVSRGAQLPWTADDIRLRYAECLRLWLMGHGLTVAESLHFPIPPAGDAQREGTLRQGLESLGI
jgi:serine/threonine protein kinase/tetratricopeptide (TPR) repeat protein/predicted esterase